MSGRKDNPSKDAIYGRKKIIKNNILKYPDLEGEVWGYADMFPNYRVSNLGRVRAVTERVMTQYKRDTGYYVINMKDSNGRTHGMKVHRIVAMVFCEKPYNHMAKFVNHKDGDKLNNKSSNLEWVTFQENVDHAVANNLHAFGERQGQSKLTVNKVANILHMREDFTQKKLGEIYGVVDSNVCAILKRKTWKQVR